MERGVMCSIATSDNKLNDVLKYGISERPKDSASSEPSIDIHEILKIADVKINNEHKRINSSLIDFYALNLPLLNQLSLKAMKHKDLRRIAESLHGTRPVRDSWMDFFDELGVETKEIMKIYSYAIWTKELPIYFAFMSSLKSFKFGEVLEALLKMERYDVLRCEKTFVESLLNSLPKEITDPKDDDSEKDEVDSKRLLSIDGKKIKILILHTDRDDHDAEDLYIQLKKEPDLYVTCLAKLRHLFLNNVFKVISLLLSEVDFFVPILSRSFMREVTSSKHGPNRSFLPYIYQLLLEDYVHKGCWNYQVKPILGPRTSMRKLQSYSLSPILELPFSWKELPDYVDMLRNTKPMVDKIKRK